MDPFLPPGENKVEKLRIYVSSATKPLNDDELAHLLKLSRARNRSEGITGLLLYFEGAFIQAYEGPTEAIENLHARIRSDSRHYGIKDLVSVNTTERSFPDWSMGLVKASMENIRGVEGLSDYLLTGDLPALTTERNALLLLEYFRKSRVEAA